MKINTNRKHDFQWRSQQERETYGIRVDLFSFITDHFILHIKEKAKTSNICEMILSLKLVGLHFG